MSTKSRQSSPGTDWCEKQLAALDGRNPTVPPSSAVPPSYRKGDDFSIWVSRMECHLHKFPEHLRTSEFLSCLDTSVYGVVSSLGLGPNSELKETIASLRAEFEPAHNLISVRRDFRRRDQLPGEKCDDFLLALRPLAKIAFPDAKEAEAALFEQFVGGITNAEVRRAFLSTAPTSLAAARTEARQKEVISSKTYKNGLDISTVGASLKGSRDVTTQTNAIGSSYNGNQQRYRHNNSQRRPSNAYQPRRQPYQNAPRVVNTVGEHDEPEPSSNWSPEAI